MQLLTCTAKVLEVINENDKTTIVLDQTVFYPQGGGQPYDQGEIKNENFTFLVHEVRFVEGKVLHIGVVQKGQVMMGESVECFVNKERRMLNTRLHSAGHLLDLVLKELNIDWKATKGYHFPQGPYVEYSGNLEGIDVDDLKNKIEEKAKEITGRDMDTTIVFNEGNMVNGKPARVVYYGDFGIPCGGTHLRNLKDIGELKIKKIKREKEVIRISYEIV